jgi:hypothetical protein
MEKSSQVLPFCEKYQAYCIYGVALVWRAARGNASSDQIAREAMGCDTLGMALWIAPHGIARNEFLE